MVENKNHFMIILLFKLRAFHEKFLGKIYLQLKPLLLFMKQLLYKNIESYDGISTM